MNLWNSKILTFSTGETQTVAARLTEKMEIVAESGQFTGELSAQRTAVEHVKFEKKHNDDSPRQQTEWQRACWGSPKVTRFPLT